MATRSRTRMDPEVRRQLILDAAERVMRDRLPTEVTFEEVADAAGVSRGLVYNYFGDRTGLLVALAERTLSRLDAEVLSAVDPLAERREQLRRLGEAYLDFARSDGETWRLLARSGLLDHPTVIASRQRRVRELSRTWGDLGDADLAAWALVALYEAAVLDPPHPPADSARLVSFVVDVLGGDLFGPTVHVAGSSDGDQARHADRPLDPLPGGPGH